MLLLRGVYVVVLFSSNGYGVDVDGRIGRCFARHKTVRTTSSVKNNLNGPMPYPGVHGYFPVRLVV